MKEVRGVVQSGCSVSGVSPGWCGCSPAVLPSPPGCCWERSRWRRRRCAPSTTASCRPGPEAGAPRHAPPLATPDTQTHLDHFLFHHRQLRLVPGLKVEFTTGEKLRLAAGTQREREGAAAHNKQLNRKWSHRGREAEPVTHFLSYHAILCYQTCYLGISWSLRGLRYRSCDVL